MTNKKDQKVATSVATTCKEKWFLGWSNIKWFIKEIISIYSGKSSFFSKKRIESGIAFIIAQWGMIFFLVHKYSTLSMGEFLLWASAEFAISGYMINQIQKEKQNPTNTNDTSN